MQLINKQITSIEEDWNRRKPNDVCACICDPILLESNSYLQEQYKIKEKLSKLWGHSGSLMSGETYLIDNMYCLAVPRFHDPKSCKPYLASSIEDLQVQMQMMLHNHIIIYVESCYPECRYNQLFVAYLVDVIIDVFIDSDITIEVCWEN